jgi:hypothetical protein
MTFNGPIATGIAVVAALFAISWGFSRWGKFGGVVVTILVVTVAGATVQPIKQVATGVVDTLQAPLTAAKTLMNQGWG